MSDATHTFVVRFKEESRIFSGEDYDEVSQDAWEWLDDFSVEVHRGDTLDPDDATVTYNGVEHKVQWELAGNLCEIYPAVFSGQLLRW